MGRFIRLYNERWNCTNRMLIIKNMLSAAVVFTICCYAVQNDVFVTYDATKSAFFALLLSLIWSGLFNSIGLYSTEASYTNDVLDKSLPLYAYMGGTLWIQLKLCFMQGLECITIYFLFYGCDQKNVVCPVVILDYFISFYLILVSADMLGLALGTCVNSVSTALTVIPIALVAQLLLSGCLFELNGIMEYISIFTTAKYGFSVLGSIGNLNGEDLPLAISKYYPEVVKQSSDLFDCSATYVLDCWKNLFCLSVIGFIIAGLSLYVKINRKH